jgi:hypothetical protein
MNNPRQLTFWIEDEDLSALQQAAKSADRSTAAVLRLIVKNWRASAQSAAPIKPHDAVAA